MSTENLVPGTHGGSHVVNTPLTTDNAAEATPGLLRNTVDERIVKVRPSATPVDQISRWIGSRPCGSMVVKYYSIDAKPGDAKVTATVSATSIVPTGEGNINFKVKVDRAAIFAATDTVLFPGVILSDGAALTAYVEHAGTEELTLVPLNVPGTGDGKIHLPKVDSGSRVVRMGRAAGELDVQTGQFQAMPRAAFNNCQIFKMQIEQSTLMRRSEKEIDWNFSDQEEAAIVDMRLGMEKNFIFGSRATISVPETSETIYFTGGIWNQTTREHHLPAGALTEKDLIALCARAFTGNNGSKKKILMGGTDLILALNKIEAHRAIMSDQAYTRWGIRFREIVSNFGTLYVVHSEIFDMCGHSGDGFILDPDFVTKYSHIPFSKECLDLRKAGDRNTDAVVLTEASCIVLRHPDAHTRVITDGVEAGGTTGGGSPF